VCDDSALIDASIKSSSGIDEPQVDALSRPWEDTFEGSKFSRAAASLVSFAFTINKSPSSSEPSVFELVLVMNG
jgi:hypothetical protein